jgi:hypothetical protein
MSKVSYLRPVEAFATIFLSVSPTAALEGVAIACDEDTRDYLLNLHEEYLEATVKRPFLETQTYFDTLPHLITGTKDPIIQDVLNELPDKECLIELAHVSNFDGSPAAQSCRLHVCKEGLYWTVFFGNTGYQTAVMPTSVLRMIRKGVIREGI